MDGWEDDDDLEIDSDGEKDFPHEDLVPSDTEQGGGEWSFDDDNVVLESDNEPTTNENNNKQSMRYSKEKEAVVEESTRLKQGAPSDINQVKNDELQESGNWSFDDDEILDDTTGDEDLKPPTQTLVNEKVEQKPPPDILFRDRLATENVSSGPNKAAEDRQQTSHAAGIKPPQTNVPSHPPPTKPPADEWSFEDDSFVDAVENESPAPPHPPSNPNDAKQEATFQSLVRYLESLPALLPSLNAVLEAEYNTYHHAVELTEYYTSRPQLYDYTLDTELPRMDYQVVLPGQPQERLTDKYQVQQYLLSQNKDDILIRSANQSLLADLLAQLTGPDCFIQHQYLATAVATFCQFVLHPSFVECHCTLTLSLPSATGDRLDVARLLVSIDFAQPPAVNYHLHKVERILDDLDVLRETAAFLTSLDQDLFVEDHAPTSDDVVRDAFLAKLSQTQQFAKDSHAGLSSAWKQIDSIANVSKKMSFLKQGLVPNDVLAAARREEALASRPPPPPPPIRESMPPVATSAMPPPPPPPNRPPPPPSSGNRDRPAPILGGLLRTGWNRLAQTVTLPDDVDTFPNEPTPTVPKLYRPENEGLDNARNALSAQGSTSDDAAPPLPPHQRIFEQRASSPLQQPLAKPNATRQEVLEVNTPKEDFQDGWGDDDLDLDVDDEDDETNIDDTETPKPPPPPPQRPSKPTAASTSAVAPPSPKRAQESIPGVKSPAPSASSRVDGLPQASLSDYNPEDDIVPTRKRWVNPRPGNRQLRV